MAIIELSIDRPALKRVERLVRPDTPEPPAEDVEDEATEEPISEPTIETSSRRPIARRVRNALLVVGLVGGAVYLLRRRRSLGEMASIEVEPSESEIEA